MKFVYLKKEQHSQDVAEFFMLVIKGEPADHDIQTCCLGSVLNYVLVLQKEF